MMSEKMTVSCSSVLMVAPHPARTRSGPLAPRIGWRGAAGFWRAAPARPVPTARPCRRAPRGVLPRQPASIPTSAAARGVFSPAGWGYSRPLLALPEGDRLDADAEEPGQPLVVLVSRHHLAPL